MFEMPDKLPFWRGAATFCFAFILGVLPPLSRGAIILSISLARDAPRCLFRFNECTRMKSSMWAASGCARRGREGMMTLSDLAICPPRVCSLSLCIYRHRLYGSRALMFAGGTSRLWASLSSSWPPARRVRYFPAMLWLRVCASEAAARRGTAIRSEKAFARGGTTETPRCRFHPASDCKRLELHILLMNVCCATDDALPSVVSEYCVNGKVIRYLSWERPLLRP